MDNNREQKERERLQKEADRERIKLPKMKIDGVEFDTSDRETRLIGKTPTWTVFWTSPKLGTEEVYELYWRTNDGSYFEYLNGSSGGFASRIDTKTAHELLNINTPDYLWFLTELQKKELKKEDERIKQRKRRL